MDNSEKLQHRVHKTKKTKQKYNIICVGTTVDKQTQTHDNEIPIENNSNGNRTVSIDAVKETTKIFNTFQR